MPQPLRRVGRGRFPTAPRLHCQPHTYTTSTLEQPAMPAPAKTVLFDLDNTLTDHIGTLNQWAEMYHQRCPQVPVSWLLDAERRWAGQRAHFFSDLRNTFGIEESVLSLMADYRQYTATHVPYRPEVCDALAELDREGWRMGLVTNGEATAQRQKLHRARLDRFFPRGLAISSEVGLRKPDKGLFLYALEDLGTQGVPALVVGDDLGADVQGALNAGLLPVWVSAGRSLGPTDPRPIHTAHTVVDAIEWLRTTAAQEFLATAA
ncbi:HAD family hydrolase [Streptomyces sp. NPDC001404]|uniref:HAD family hydrolase n=1 Tax=Streptomyces sp. NPDC001404 TaxID=3364571 RepID=UPI0036BE9278